MKDIKVLIIGAGPAGLAAAIRIKQKLNKEKIDESVVVIDKAFKPGYHNLSGAIFESGCLDELIPGWKEESDSFINDMIEIKRDEMYFLTLSSAIKIPHFIIPPPMHREGNYAISVGKLVNWLSKKAADEGVEIYSGFSAKDILMDNNCKVLGVKLIDLGIDRTGGKKSNYLPGDVIKANITVFADGSRGSLSLKLTDLIGGGLNPQIYSVGIKQLIKLPDNNLFGSNHSIHTLGFPNRKDVYGGGFIYSMGDNLIALGLIMGLDWKYQDLDPQQELEQYKSHKFISRFIEGGEVISCGAKTLPEGGYYSIPELVTDGALIVGDAAGFTNTEKLKGLHYAIRSGIYAADTIFEAILANDFSKTKLQRYRQLLKNKVFDELYKARNFRQSFKSGIYFGIPLAIIQNLIPFRLKLREDYPGMKRGIKLNRKYIGLDKTSFVNLSSTKHKEDEWPHVRLKDTDICLKCCTEEYGNPCVYFCPGGVYSMIDKETVLTPSNCLHDCLCVAKCPYQNIEWDPPEGGEGPRYKNM